jgi:SOS-response transcriptional repressor LexA
MSADSREALSPRQRVVLEFIGRFAASNGYPPTVREIREAIGVKSTNGVCDHLAALERKGYIRRDPLKSRGLVLCYAIDDELVAEYHRTELVKVEKRIAARKMMSAEASR